MFAPTTLQCIYSLPANLPAQLSLLGSVCGETTPPPTGLTLSVLDFPASENKIIITVRVLHLPVIAENKIIILLNLPADSHTEMSSMPCHKYMHQNKKLQTSTTENKCRKGKAVRRVPMKSPLPSMKQKMYFGHQGKCALN